MQGGHLSGKPGNVREFCSCQGLLRALYRLFKDVPVRRAQCVEATGKSVFHSKFICEIRWTQNAAVGKRALDIIDDVTKFVKTVKLSSVDAIKEAMSDPLYRPKAKLACFVSNAQMLQGFLTAFQSIIHDDQTDIVKGLTKRCVEPEIVEKANTSSQLMKIELGLSKNMLLSTLGCTGSVCPCFFRKGKSYWFADVFSDQLPKVSCCNNPKKLIERCSLKYNATKAIACLNPFTATHNRSIARMGDFFA